MKPTPGSHEPYGFVNENANLDTLDALFNSSTGHAHNAAHKGAKIAPAGMAEPLTLTAPHFTTPVVDSGGLTVTLGGITVNGGGLTVAGGTTATGLLNITSGGLSVTNSSVGVGVAPLAGSGIVLGSTITASGGIGQAIRVASSIATAGNSDSLAGFYVAPTFTDAGNFTTVTQYGINIVPTFFGNQPSTCGWLNLGGAGPGNSSTTVYGEHIQAITGADQNHYGLQIEAPSGASGNNWSLNCIGIAVFQNQIAHQGTTLGFYSAAAVSQQNGTGNTHTVAAGSATNVFTNTTFDGSTGSTAYTVGDVVRALKNYGLLAA